MYGKHEIYTRFQSLEEADEKAGSGTCGRDAPDHLNMHACMHALTHPRTFWAHKGSTTSPPYMTAPNPAIIGLLLFTSLPSYPTPTMCLLDGLVGTTMTNSTRFDPSTWTLRMRLRAGYVSQECYEGSHHNHPLFWWSEEMDDTLRGISFLFES